MSALSIYKQIPTPAPIALPRYFSSDLPWPYNDRREYRLDNPERKAKSGIGAAGKYGKGVMSIEELCDLGPLVRPVVASDAYLLQWATLPLLPQALTVMDVWGWRYSGSCMVWVKCYPKLFRFSLDFLKELVQRAIELAQQCVQDALQAVQDMFHFHLAKYLFRGPGYYVPSNVEILMLGIRRGSKPWHATTGFKPPQVVIAPHPRDTLTGKIIHSRKPEIFQDHIDQWLSPHAGFAYPEKKQTKWSQDESGKPVATTITVPRGAAIPTAPPLELFATRRRPGWTCLGHELTGTDIRDDLRQLATNPSQFQEVKLA